MKAQKEGANYLYIVLGGLFIVALLIILAYALVPFEGCVGVVEIKGDIVSDGAGATLFSDEVKGSQAIADEIAAADRRSDVKSLLVLIDSPGGSVVASREIYDALSKVNKSKVAYIHELGASGAYYAAVGTDYIVANPDAITGSIGAKSVFEDMSGLFEKIGYNATVVKTGEMKDMGNPARELTEGEIAVMQSIVDESFAEFKSAIVKGRGGHLDGNGFETALDGRIMSGRQALRIGLVDANGDQRLAEKKAAEMGGISSEEPRICEISVRQRQKGVFGSLASSLADALQSQAASLPRFLYK